MLFNWFVEWTRKQFGQYLKTHIQKLYVGNRLSEIKKKNEEDE